MVLKLKTLVKIIFIIPKEQFVTEPAVNTITNTHQPTLIQITQERQRITQYCPKVVTGTNEFVGAVSW